MKTAFKAYDTSGTLRHVGGGKAMVCGENVGTRWIVGAVETFTFKTTQEALAFIVRETQKIGQKKEA